MESTPNLQLRQSESKRLFAKGERLLPGGVSSPGRAFAEVEALPLFVGCGNGKYIEDVDGNRYIDFVCGLGPAILGHGHPEVASAIAEQFARGAVFGMPNEIEYRLAEIILESSRYLDQIRFTCSGTEATMTCLRIARAATGRSAVIKFVGGYHGHSDALLAGGTKRHMLANAAKNRLGNDVEASISANTFLAEYNDASSVEVILKEQQGLVAAIIVEPVASNMGVIPPAEGFLAGLRALADEAGTILIFDEVVSGFRHRFGPVADNLGIRPDLIAFGKIIGGGLPVGAFGGRRDLMSLLVARGRVFQGGTFAGSPLTMAAGLAQLSVLRRTDALARTNDLAAMLAVRLRDEFKRLSLPFSAQSYGSLVTPILVGGRTSLSCYNDVAQQDRELFSRIYSRLLFAGFALPPTIEEPIFVSACHTEDDVGALANAFAEAAAHCLH